MAYSDFSLVGVKKAFGLTETRAALFEPPGRLEPSVWLRDTLGISLKLARSSSSEKARSEFIVVPILLEMERRNEGGFALFSGERLDIDPTKGLRGECDFILSRGPISSTIDAPILLLVEAKKNDIKEGLGQCIAQMIGASVFNQREENTIPAVYGCVTTGEDWQFLRIEGSTVSLDEERYYINDVARLLWVLQAIINEYS